MKITRVECLVLASEHPIVRIESDEGIVGWGECFRRARALPGDQTVETVRAIRRAVGDGVEVLVDVNGAYSADAVKAAGLTELQKIAALPQATNKPMTVHNTQPTLCTAAHLHFCAVHPNVPYEQEYNIEPVSIRDRWPILPGRLVVKDGFIAVPDGPGLGVQVDEPLVRRLAEMTGVAPGL